MAGETPVTVVGNATADAEIKFTATGAALATVTVASTPRTFDKASGQWKDREALFLRCTGWRDLAEHMSQTITKGMRLIVSGRLEQRSFQDQDGNSRTVVELQIDEIGPSLRYATASVNKAERSTATTAPAVDPWSLTDDAPF